MLRPALRRLFELKNGKTVSLKNRYFSGEHKIHQKVSFEKNCNREIENCLLKHEISRKRHPETGLHPTKKGVQERTAKPRGETKKS